MIDWLSLALNAIWIAGCMLALAVLSISQWQTRRASASASPPLRLRDVLARPRAQIALLGAAILFGLGMLGTSSAWYEQIAWGALVIAFLVQTILAYRKRWKS